MKRPWFAAAVHSLRSVTARDRRGANSRSRPQRLAFDALEPRAMLAVDVSPLEVASPPAVDTAGMQFAALTRLANPSAPTDVVAMPGDGIVNLIWRVPDYEGSNPIRTYRIIVSADGGATWTKIARPASVARVATIAGLENGKNYAIRIIAMNGYKGLPSETVYATVRRPDVVSAGPLQVTARRDGDRTVALTWLPPTAPSNGVVRYVIYHSTDGQSWTRVVRPASAELTATVGGLTNGTGYSFKVVAVTADGARHESLPTQFMARPGTVPGVATNLVVAKVAGVVTFTWDPPVDDGGRRIIDYEIHWSARPPSSSALPSDGRIYPLYERRVVRSEPGTSPSLTIPEVDPEATYVFSVQARNRLGSGGLAGPYLGPFY